MTNIYWPELQIKTVLSGILTAVGRDIKINIKQTGIPCPNCLTSGYLDPVTNTSTYSFCGICQGKYFLNTVSGILVNAHVKWNNAETQRFYPGGIIPDGDCLVTLSYSSTLRDQIEKSKNFEIDGKKLTLKSYKLRGAKSPNRILLTLNEESN